MKSIFRLLLLAAIICVFSTSCGYKNPYTYSGPDRTIYVTNWKNRTSQLQLDSKIYQSLLEWFQKSGSLKVTKKKEGSDFILAGEIISIDLPTLTYSASNSASQVKIRLKVRYILKDISKNTILFEKSKETWTQDYVITTNYSTTKDNEDTALATIIDEMSQKIYQNSLLAFAKM